MAENLVHTDTLFNAIGIAGMLVILLAYFMLQLSRWQASQPRYLIANIFGSLLLIISLCWHWNLALFMLQSAWVAISLFGLFKHKNKSKADSS